MKKHITLFCTIILISIASYSYAQNSDPKDTTIYFNHKKIDINDDSNNMKIKVYSKDSLEEYKQIYEGIYTEEKSYEKWSLKENLGWDLDLFATKRKSEFGYMESTWDGIGWGFSTITDGNNWNNVNGVEVNAERSNEFFINPFSKVIPLIGNTFGVSTGLGVSWHNLFLKNNTHFIEKDDKTVIEKAPEGIFYDSSRLRTFQINIPLLLEFQPVINNRKEIYFSAGIVGGINVFSSQKVKYINETGRKIKEIDKNKLNLSRLTMDFMGQVGYGSFGIFAKYSPFSMFLDGKGPEVQMASIGLKLNF